MRLHSEGFRVKGLPPGRTQFFPVARTALISMSHSSDRQTFSALATRRRFLVRAAAVVGAPALIGLLQACVPAAPSAPAAQPTSPPATGTTAAPASKAAAPSSAR